MHLGIEAKFLSIPAYRYDSLWCNTCIAHGQSFSLASLIQRTDMVLNIQYRYARAAKTRFILLSAYRVFKIKNVLTYLFVLSLLYIMSIKSDSKCTWEPLRHFHSQTIFVDFSKRKNTPPRVFWYQGWQHISSETGLGSPVPAPDYQIRPCTRPHLHFGGFGYSPRTWIIFLK